MGRNSRHLHLYNLVLHSRHIRHPHRNQPCSCQNNHTPQLRRRTLNCQRLSLSNQNCMPPDFHTLRRTGTHNCHRMRWLWDQNCMPMDSGNRGTHNCRCRLSLQGRSCPLQDRRSLNNSKNRSCHLQLQQRDRSCRPLDLCNQTCNTNNRMTHLQRLQWDHSCKLSDLCSPTKGKK